jgi:hypothetical protein
MLFITSDLLGDFFAAVAVFAIVLDPPCGLIEGARTRVVYVSDAMIKIDPGKIASHKGPIFPEKLRKTRPAAVPRKGLQPRRGAAGTT